MMKTLLSSWQWQPVTLVLLLLCCLAFGRLWRFRVSRAILPFSVATILAALCFFSPLGVLSSHYLFSAHMAVHVILLLLVGPLFVMALPENLPVWMQSFLHLFVRQPLLGWVLGVGIMWFWHVPVIFNSVMHETSALHHFLHLVETVSLILSGMLFSYPVLSPKKSLAPLTAVVYLFSACVFCSLLGLLITFAPVGLYHHFLAAADSYHLNPLITQEWGMTRGMDQQAAGLIMWVPCCMIYVVASLYLLKNWFDEKHVIPQLPGTVEE